MVAYIRDATGRFPQRPHYKPAELDRECESIVNSFLKDLHGKVQFPFTTDDLVKLIDRDTSDLDQYADLSDLGTDVEGVTEFWPKKKPAVKVAARLTEDDRRENRLRTTLSHEYGHVRLHAYLWELFPPAPDLLRAKPQVNKQICKRETIMGARETDWMEWQAGYVCGALLVPASAAKRALQGYMERHNLFGMLRTNSWEGQGAIRVTMDEFLVSQDAARVRLLQLGILGDAPSGSLFG